MKKIMNKVTPVKTPWMVSSTERELTVEKLSKNRLKVGFLGFFGKDIVNDEIIDKYDNVEVIFSGLEDFRHFPEYSSDDSKRIDSYDWELVPEFRDEAGSLAQHGEIFHKVWKKTGFCPDPAVYEIEDSEWVSSMIGNKKRLKHYLVLGGDYNLEVLSTEMAIN
jgi:hypothetical protein